MKEIRMSNLEIRANDENSRIIEGYAVRFNEWSRDLGGFTEIIRSGAITNELLQNSDVVMCVNHDQDKMVARSRNGEGTLQLDLREDGLYFMFDAPNTALGDELLFNVRSGNLFECSFAFSIDSKNANCERWYNENGNLKREIFEISGLYDCSIVTHAAYPTTSVSSRFEEVKHTKEEVDKMCETIISELENY